MTTTSLTQYVAGKNTSLAAVGDAWLEMARQRVAKTYKGQDLTPAQLESLAYRDAIASTRATREVMAHLEVRYIYDVLMGIVFRGTGETTIDEWLDAGDLLEDARATQLAYIATKLIPWCEVNGVTTKTGPVGIAWFEREIDKKCIASRTRNVLAILRLHMDSLEPLKVRVLKIAQVLADVENPALTNKYLTDMHSKGSPDEIAINAFPAGKKIKLEIEVDPQQYKWMLRKLANVSQVNQMPDSIVIDMGLAWFNPRCLHEADETDETEPTKK